MNEEIVSALDEIARALKGRTPVSEPKQLVGIGGERWGLSIHWVPVCGVIVIRTTDEWDEDNCSISVENAWTEADAWRKAFAFQDIWKPVARVVKEEESF